jgi:hypothetical protein
MVEFSRKIHNLNIINEFFEGACEHWSINFRLHIGYLIIYRLKHAHICILGFCVIWTCVNICLFHSKEIFNIGCVCSRLGCS